MTDHNARQAGLIEAADFIANKADTYAREHGVSDMGSLSFGNDDMRDYHWGLLELADEIRALAAHSADARNGEAVALTDMRWRDVSVEKPTHAQQVLFVRNGKVHFGAWINDIFWYSNEKVCALYWMPLPEAPTLVAPAAPAPKCDGTAGNCPNECSEPCAPAPAAQADKE